MPTQQAFIILQYASGSLIFIQNPEVSLTKILNIKKMRITINILLLSMLLNVSNINGQSANDMPAAPSDQKNDSTRSAVVLIKKGIVPVALISIGLIANNSNCEKQFQENLRNKAGNDYEFKIDDYLPYVPIVEMYAADALGVNARNHWFDQTKYMVISNVVTSLITHGLKRITNKTRPNGSPHSFPSGHTSFAFTNATVLMNEFNTTSPVLAYSGYVFATTTGAFRMVNNWHWLSDVLVGAGIGMFVTELVYYFEPFRKFNPFKKTRNITLTPQIDERSYGFYLAYRF